MLRLDFFLPRTEGNLEMKQFVTLQNPNTIEWVSYFVAGLCNRTCVAGHLSQIFEVVQADLNGVGGSRLQIYSWEP